MKTPLLTLLAISIMAVLTCGASAISPEEAAKHVGETATVTGTVASVFVSKNENVFLNFGAAYPRQTFAAVWFVRNGVAPASLAGYEGKQVAVTGKIQLYQGKPEIVLTSPDQIRTAQ